MEQQIQKLKGQLNEAKIKKDSIVIPKTGVHKGDRHIVIHDFGDGTYNIMPASGLIKVKYRLGAARAKASDLTLVKEDQLNENSIGKVNESKAPRELKKHIGKTVKDFKYDYDGESHYLTTVFTDGTKMTITAYGEYPDGAGMDFES